MANPARSSPAGRRRFPRRSSRGVRLRAAGLAPGGLRRRGPVGGPGWTRPAGIRPLLILLAALSLRSAAWGQSEKVESGAAAPATSEGERLLRRIAEDLGSLETFRAEFEQRQEWVGMDPSPPYRGSFFLKRPNLFRIEYREPEGHLQVSDGSKVWTWIPENGEVLVADLASAGSAGGDLLRWIVTHSRALPEVESDAVAGRPARRLTLDPEEGLGLSRVRLWVAPDGPEIRQYEIEEESGNRTVYRLLRTDRNPTLKDDLFRFSAPEGVPVVELGAP